jgi:hypothetical protein
MQIRILKSQLDEIGESAEWDAGDHAWWVRDRADNAVESTIELINEHLFEKDQIVIIPEEKYLKCTCQFEKKGEYVSSSQTSYGGYREVFKHIEFCEEHADENPDLYDANGHPKNCRECAMEHED